MMRLFKSKKVLIRALVAALAAIALFFAFGLQKKFTSMQANEYALAETTKAKPSVYAPVFATPEEASDAAELGRILSELNSATLEAAKEGRIKAEDFELLEFDWLGDPGYGDNIDYEVFNPKSSRSLPKFSERSIFTQQFLDRITSVKGTLPIFSLRREMRGVMKQDTLYVLIPNIKESICREGVYFRPISEVLHFEEDNKQLVEQFGFNGCVRDGDAKFYRSIELLTRLQRPQGGSWTLLVQRGIFDIAPIVVKEKQ